MTMAPENQPAALQATQAVEQPSAPPAAPATTPSGPALPFDISRLDKWAVIQYVAFAIIALWTVVNIALLWVNGIDPMGIVWALWWPGIFLVQYTVLTTPWRAVTVKEIGRMFLVGMGLVFFASYWGELIMTSIITAYPDFNPIYRILTLDFLLGRGVNILADVSSPIVEETFKIVPVVVFLLIAGRGYWRRALGPLDVALLGGASGAGFLFMENLARETAGYWSRLGPDRSVWVASPGINPFYIFPDMYHGDVSIWMGHPEATMFIGLALGFGLLIRKKFPIWPIIPVIAFAWVTWLHFLINYSLGQQFWAQLVVGLRLNGGLIGYVLEFGLLAGLIIAMVTKYLYLQKDKDATVQAVVKETMDYINASSGQPLLIAKKLWGLRHFWSFRHAVAYGALYAKQQKPGERTRDWIEWLAGLRDQALGKVV